MSLKTSIPDALALSLARAVDNTTSAQGAMLPDWLLCLYLFAPFHSFGIRAFRSTVILQIPI